MSEDFNPISDEAKDAPLEFPVVHASRFPEPDGGSTEPLQPVSPYEATPAPTLWDKIRERLAGKREPLSLRIEELTRTIEVAPETAANYVLRGELYLQSGQYERALGDFQRGLELARADYEKNAWGLVAQAVQDRALKGLERAQGKLTIERNNQR